MRGELPEGWEIGKISDFSKSIDEPVQTGPFGAQLHSSDYVDEGVPLILIKNVFGGKIIEKNLPQISQDKANALRRYQLKKDDIVFSRVGSVGRVAVVQEHQAGWLISGQMLRVRLENPEIDSKFLNYMIQTKWFSQCLENEIVGTTRKSINSDILRNLPLLKPPISVQRQIVAVLEQAEAVKRQRQEADALTGALLQNVFNEMFGDPVRNEKGWDVVKIREITEKSQYGCSVLGIDGGQYPIIGMNNITYEGKIDLKNLKYVNLSQKEFENFKLESGDILFNRTNAPNLVGKTGLFHNGENFVFASYLIRLKLKMDVVDPVFLWIFLNSSYMKNKFSGMCKKAVNQANINAQELQNISIPLPPLALQQQFARVIESVERIRDQQVASGRQIEGLCEGLMQRAFAGELAT